MPFSPSFEATQSWGAPSQITLTDNSTGSDASIASRRIYFTKYNNGFLVPSGTATDYVEWPISSDTITVDLLDKDYALNVVLQFVDVDGNVLYTTNQVLAFTLYNKEFLYDLTQDISSAYQIIQDANYYSNKMLMIVEINSGENAISPPYDIAGAQSCFDRATALRLNQKFSF